MHIFEEYFHSMCYNAVVSEVPEIDYIAKYRPNSPSGLAIYKVDCIPKYGPNLLSGHKDKIRSRDQAPGFQQYIQSANLTLGAKFNHVRLQ